MKKWVKIVLLSIAGILLILAGIIGYFYINYKIDSDTEGKPYKHYIGYIDQEKALLNDRYKLCYDDKNIYYTYNGAGLKAYKGFKKQFRDNLNATYNATTSHSDSGYLNFRFLVNCEGNAGWFEIIQMDLDLEETKLDDAMVEDLFKFTAEPMHWNRIDVKDNPVNYYMYVSYRIENGKITEIIP